MNPSREEHLLGLAGDLANRLETVQVPLLSDLGSPRRESADVGISPSALGNVASFLNSEQDLESFSRFVHMLDQLDSLVGQNQANPKAEHTVLKRELLRFLREQPELTAPEHLYVLKWAQRLLPATRKGMSVKRRKTASQRERRRPSRPSTGFTQLGEALRGLKKDR